MSNHRLRYLWSRLIYLLFTEPFLWRAKRRVCSLIMDFDFPLESDRSFTALIIRLIERIAGKEHYGNFLNFMEAGGVSGLLRSLDCRQWKRCPVLRNRGGVFELRPGKR